MSFDVLVDNLGLQYRDGHQALTGVNLSITAGENVSLTGANGAGKSTLLRCLVHLKKPTDGEVFLGDVNVTQASPRLLRQVRGRVGFIFQGFGLVSRASAFHNVINGGLGREGVRCSYPFLAPQEIRQEAMTCLDRVGLAHLAQQRVDTLSGGQRQRVAIARVLMQRPEVILADEPVASLDPAAGRAIMGLLRDIATDSGITVISVLHQLELSLEYTDRIIGLHEGRLVMDEPAHSLSLAQLEGLYGRKDPDNATID